MPEQSSNELPEGLPDLSLPPEYHKLPAWQAQRLMKPLAGEALEVKIEPKVDDLQHQLQRFSKEIARARLEGMKPSSGVSEDRGLSTEEPTGKSPQVGTMQSTQLGAILVLINLISALGIRLEELATQLRRVVMNKTAEQCCCFSEEDSSPGQVTSEGSVQGSQPDPIVGSPESQWAVCLYGHAFRREFYETCPMCKLEEE